MSAEVKPGYKLTETGVIPDDWDVMTLGTVSEMSSGTTPSRSLMDRYYKNGSIAWVKTLDLNNSDICETDECVTDFAMKETCLRVNPVGTVLVAMYGGYNQIGRTGLLRLPAAVNQAITAIHPTKGKLLSDYLIRNLNYRIDYWKRVASSSRKDPNITSKDVRDFPVACPKLHEQEAIAEALSDADALIESLEQLITKKRQIKQGAMQELLTGKKRLPGFSGEWEVKLFDDVLIRVNTKVNQIQTIGYQMTGVYPVIDQGKVAVIGFSDREDKLLKCPEGGVIVFGDHTCIVKFIDFDFLVGADGTQIIQGRSGQSTIFHAFQLQYRGVEPTGYNRHFKFLKERNFLMPKLPEQTAIANVLSDMGAEIDALETKLAKVQKIKRGMMYNLLTGKIRLT
ncbi:MAG: restriction endonuclease subunit S [Pelodictyon phaeoclathratiforme]